MSFRYQYCPQCKTELSQQEHAGITRRACPAENCGFIHYDNPIPVVAAIVQRGDNVILVRQPNWPAKWFGLVTGFLERDETPEEGVLREVQEELGLEASIEELVGVYAFTMKNELLIAYHVRVDGEPNLGEELAEYKLVPIDKLRPWPNGNRGRGSRLARRPSQLRARTRR